MKMDLKKVFVVGTAGFLVVCLGLFYVLTNSMKATGRSQRERNMENMEKKLEVLEEAFKSHRISMKELETLALSEDNEIQQDVNQKQLPNRGNPIADFQIDKDKKEISPASCSASVGLEKQAEANINMLDAYEAMKFDNPDGGVWKQGFDIKIDENRFTESNKLQVFVIPHSHNDPGWLKTFEKYFEDQTRHILDSMLEGMTADPNTKFIWCEISYFDLWWRDLTDEKKHQIQQLIQNKQLEFVTGGWVMPDESSSHFYSILLQLTEGHQWLSNHLNYIPKNGWAIDPFGMSPTMAYILRRAGLSNMLIQRTHYSVKKHLAKLQNLEFRWRQIWDSAGSTDILCHMMPFYSYDVPHTCGPDPKVCCQFDFKRMRGVSTMTCPWHIPPQPIIAQNVRERSLTLLDQYKKKSMLYKTNTLLIPLGDDFRWEDKKEWDAQVTNYAKIFDYVNSQPSLNTQIQFGTLDDYFQALNGQIEQGQFEPGILSGDFFTYADRDDHYWSGYFTSRPFHKAMDRELMGHLRAAHIAFTMMTAEIAKKTGSVQDIGFVRDLLGKLIRARRNLSLFQHHDGVAGTAKDHVMVDYAEKMHTGLNACNFVMQQSLQVLTHLKDASFELEKMQEDANYYEPTISKDHHHSLPRHNIIIIDREISDRLISVFNPAAHARTQLVTVYTSTYYIKVVSVEGDPIDFEVLPVFKDQTTLASNIFQVNFVTDVPQLGVRNFIIKYDPSHTTPEQPDIVVVNAPSKIFDHEKFRIQTADSGASISISNDIMTVNFNKDGFMDSAVVKDKSIPLNIAMYKYGAKNRQETSGLYLFIPDGPATALDVVRPFVKIVKGKFLSYVEVWLKQVKHRVTLYNHPGFDRYSIDVSNVVDIKAESNFELVMKLTSDIKSNDISYTDLNGFQIIRRKRFEKIPIQGNYYPLPAATYIEDSEVRMTVLSRQPLGTASLNSGEIEIIMDRRLMQDDNRGAGQGDKDNLETLNDFRILLEIPQCQDAEAAQKAPMLSLAAHITLQDMLHPFRTFSNQADLTPSILAGITDYDNAIDGVSPLACDVELVDMTMLPKYTAPLDDLSYTANPEASVTIRRVGFDGRFFDGIPMPQCSYQDNQLGRFSMKNMIGDLFNPKISQMTLSFVHEGKKLSAEESILMTPMEIYGFKAHFQIANGG